MTAIWWLLLGGAALAAASELFKRRKAPELPDTSDEDFVNLYRLRFDSSYSTVIQERNLIAECLGVPSQKLSPSHTFEYLSKFTGFITEYEIGMSDLGDELAHYCKQAGLKMPDPFPETVEDYIHDIINAKERSKESESPLPSPTTR